MPDGPVDRVELRPAAVKHGATRFDCFDIQSQIGCDSPDYRLGVPRIRALRDRLPMKRRGTLPREFDEVHGSVLGRQQSLKLVFRDFVLLQQILERDLLPLGDRSLVCLVTDPRR